MTDLSGAWRGIFNYPRELPATAFAALLRDADGAISGEIDELDIFSPDRRPIGALVDGCRKGDAVRFVKYYDAPEGYDVVHYAGEVAPSGDEITGRWTIPGVWSGTFIMTREPAPAVAVEVETGVSVHR